MPITINGSGTITGISAGGLPDGVIQTADIADANITAAKLDGAQSGSAPIYAARAWVNFNGTGTVAIRASGNVSSITDNGTGNYTVNFATAMPDVNYSCIGSNGTDQPSGIIEVSSSTPATSQQIFSKNGTNNTSVDQSRINVAIFR